jgi:hypothetical protein
MCSLRFENNLLTIEGVRFASISKKTPLSKLSFAFVSLALPLLVETNGLNADMEISQPYLEFWDPNATGEIGWSIPVWHSTAPSYPSLKTHSMAVRAIPLSVCHQGPPNGYRTGFKRCSDAQQFIQLTVVDDINAKSG